MVAAVGPRLQVQPLVKPEGGQLDDRIGRDVAREDRKVKPSVRGQGLQELRGAGAWAAVASDLLGGGRQLRLEAFEHGGEVGGIFTVEQRQVLPHDLGVRLAAHRDSPGRGLAEHCGDGPVEDGTADFPRPDQGPVDIEEQQPPYRHSEAY